MFGKRVGRLGVSGGPTLAQRVAAILRRFGSDAHVYLPGIGRLSGFDASNFIDSAGTQPGVVDSPVGLVLNANGSLGVELLGPTWVLSPTNDSGGASFSAGVGRVFSTDGTYKSITQGLSGLTPGRSYLATIRVTSISGAVPSITISFSTGGVGQRIITAVGTYQVVIVPNTPTPTLEIKRTGSTSIVDATFDNISVREVPGIPLTQATTANKPILRQVGSRYHWEFDGVNDSLSLGSVPFQMADDHAVIAGVEFGPASFRTVFGIGNTASGNALLELSLETSGFIQYVTRDNVTNTRIALGSSGGNLENSRRVVSGGIRSGTVFVRSGGVTRATALTDIIGETTLNSASIGARGGVAANFMLGPIYPVIAIKGTVPDADLLLIERFVGQLSGVTI